MAEDEEMDAVVAELRAQFLAQLPEHMRAIKEAAAALGAAAPPAQRYAAATKLLHHAHRLAGGGALVGHAAISAAAAPVEELLTVALQAGEEPAVPESLATLVEKLLATCAEAIPHRD